MNRLPWAPLNAGIFLIILGGVFLAVFLTGIGFFTAFPLIFTFFGVWLIAEAFIFSPLHAYSPPRRMIVLWGALTTDLGIVWLVLYVVPMLFTIVLALVLVIAGIVGVAYSFSRASLGTSKTSTS
jgi:hypothetical protein